MEQEHGELVKSVWVHVYDDETVCIEPMTGEEFNVRNVRKYDVDINF